MYVRIDPDFKVLVKSIKKQVAKKLKVHHSEISLVLCTSGNSGDNGDYDICFECKKGYANLTIKDGHLYLIDFLEGFMENKNVTWEYGE